MSIASKLAWLGLLGLILSDIFYLAKCETVNVHIDSTTSLQLQDANYYNNQAVILETEGNWDAARQFYETSLEMGVEPRYQARWNLSNVYSQLGRTKDCLRMWHKIFVEDYELMPESNVITAILQYTRLLKDNGQLNSAFSLLDASLITFKDQMELHLEFAMVLLSLSSPIDCIPHLTQCVDIGNRHSIAEDQLPSLPPSVSISSDARKSLANCYHALAINGVDNAVFMPEIGITASMLESAEIFGRNSMKYNPNNPKFMHTVARILGNAGKFEESRKLHQESERLAISSNSSPVSQDSLSNSEKLMRSTRNDILHHIQTNFNYSSLLVSDRPFLMLSRQLLVNIDFHVLKKLARELFSASRSAYSVTKSIRSSYITFITPLFKGGTIGEGKLFNLVVDSMFLVTGFPIDVLKKSLEVQVVYYEDKGYFDLHKDVEPLYQRIMTVFTYLSSPEDDCWSGGSTHFPYITNTNNNDDTNHSDFTGHVQYLRPTAAHLGACPSMAGYFTGEDDDSSWVSITPSSGMSLAWFNYDESGREDHSMMHCGGVVSVDETCHDIVVDDDVSDRGKWAMNIWLNMNGDVAKLMEKRQKVSK